MSNHADKVVPISDNKVAVADGPLSLQCAQVLHAVYGKEQKENSMSIESQAIDAAINESVWAAAATMRNEQTAHGVDVSLVYGVTEKDAGSSDIVNVSNAFSEMTPRQLSQSIIVIDNKEEILPNGQTKSSPSYVNPFATALESLAREQRVKVVNSFEALKVALRRR